jgi:hypothetical protein
MPWTVETLNGVVDAELEALPKDMQARFVYISRLIEEFGTAFLGQFTSRRPDGAWLW